MPAAVKPVVVSEQQPQEYEDQHVHAVYDQIAPHFSSTRYKACRKMGFILSPWPIIAAFLASLPTGWIGFDSGTGNGKYLPLPLDRPGSIWTIGMDRSRNLLQIARTAGEGNIIREVVWGDVLGHPWRDGAFDYAISIATIHHLSTYSRRKLAVQASRLLQSISPSHGRALIYVWAIEQDDLSKRSIPAETPTEQGGQDVFVPWVMTSQTRSKPKKNVEKRPSQAQPSLEADNAEAKVFNRYYHMFAQGELRQLVCDAAQGMGLSIGPKSDISTGMGIEIVQDGWERSNYYVELHRWNYS
ncbi:S-adenosyl-L-methionine-dependent methyltransferase [Panus rudis PR-1116 ss-1]|nr:S-adenosyl-L-methionine-dependent methyltransferase [Panus rudis PR-1116 ss-1]